MLNQYSKNLSPLEQFTHSAAGLARGHFKPTSSTWLAELPVVAGLGIKNKGGK